MTDQTNHNHQFANEAERAAFWNRRFAADAAQPQRRVYRYFEAEPTPETLAHHAQELAWWRRRHREMFEAPQPESLPPVDGPSRLDMQAEFPALAETYSQRERASSTDGLIRLHAIGWCLSPIVNPGDALWVDTRATPKDGDIVTVAMPPEVCQKFIEWGKSIPGYLETYGTDAGPVMSKMLRAVGGTWYVCTNNNAFPLGDARVLGVVRRIERGAGAGGAGVAVQTSCAAAPGSLLYTDSVASITGIDISNPSFGALSVTIPSGPGYPDGGGFVINVAGRMQRTGGSGSDFLTAQLDDTGSGSFSGIRYAQWQTTANGDTSFSIACTYEPTGNGPWVIELDIFNGGGLGVFAVTDVSMAVTQLTV